jgi:hypothetical protein
MYSPTCFGRPHAHHQELNNCCSSLWFYYWSVVIAVLIGRGRAGSQPARPRQTALLLPRSNGKTRGCYNSCWAPEDGREDTRKIFSCTQTSSNTLEKLLHLVGWFIGIVWWCTDLQTLNLKPSSHVWQYGVLPQASGIAYACVVRRSVYCVVRTESLI